MFVGFDRIKFTAARYVQGHQEFPGILVDFLLWLLLNFAAKDQTTLAQHPSHTRISQGWVNVIFRPYGRKLSLKFRYFPSIQTKI